MDPERLNRATTVQKRLNHMVGGVPGVMGIGIGLTPDRRNIAVEVLLQTKDVPVDLPAELDGIAVTRKIVGSVQSY